MGSIILSGVLLVLSLSQVYCRAVDEIDNSIQSGSDNFFDKRDWVLIPRQPPTKVTQTLGSPVELVCEVMGSPAPSVQWIEGDVPIEEMENYESNIVSEASPNAIVRVKSVLIIEHMLSTEKTFTCVGRNGGNYLYASTKVYPEHPTKSLSQLLLHKTHALSGPQKPRIIYSFTQYIDVVGSSVVLPCKSIGRPRPEIYWLDNNGAVITDKKRFRILPNGDLYISDLKWDDMGVFNCIARNSLGKDTVGTFIYPASKE